MPQSISGNSNNDSDRGSLRYHSNHIIPVRNTNQTQTYTKLASIKCLRRRT